MAETTTSTKLVETMLLRSLTDEEAKHVDGLYRLASLRLRLLVPDLQRRLSAGTLDPELVDATAAEMVAVVLRNPDGVHSRTVTTANSLSIDDYSESSNTSTQESIDRARAEGMLFPTDRQLEALRARGGRAFTVHPGR